MTLFSTLLISVASLLLGSGHATLVFAGDAMQHQSQLDNARCPDGSFDYSHYFSAIEPYIKSADYAVVNLETPIGQKGFSGYPMFCAPAAYPKALGDAGFDMLLTANNHTLDRRDRGLRHTYAVLDSLGVDHIGTYPSTAVRKAALPFIRDINGFKVAFLNYTYGTNGIRIQTDAVVDYIDTEKIRTDVRQAREAGAEIVVACMHWGEEYRLLPSAAQKRLADRLEDMGVDLIIGSHPHVIQPMELRCDTTTGHRTFICYSLGNFISGMRTADTRGGALARIVLGRDSLGNARIDSASYRLVFTVVPWMGAKNFRLVDAFTDTVPDGARTHRRIFRDNALRIFNAHNKNVGLDTLPLSAYRIPYKSVMQKIEISKGINHSIDRKTLSKRALSIQK